jgi:hypothetical protein
MLNLYWMMVEVAQAIEGLPLRVNADNMVTG